MINSPALLRVLAYAVPLESHEAVAVAQQVIYNRVVAGEPVSVEEFGDVLERLLAATPRMPAALRYTAARATGDVQAPPFESVQDLALALHRFEVGDRATVVRTVLDRARPPRRPAAFGPLTAAAAIAMSFACGWWIGTPVRHPSASRAPLEATAIAPFGETVPAHPVPNVPHVATRIAPAPVVRAIAEDRNPEFSPSFASDGTAVFFHTGRTNAEASAIKAAGQLDGDLRIMTIVDDGARNYHVQPSPDGKRIAFDSDRDGERSIYIANADGTDVERLTTGGYAAVPSWSPDGRRIAFVRAETDRPRVWNVWLLDLDTRALRRVTRFPYGQTWGASWFRDGRHIAYTHESRLAVLDLESGEERDYDSPVPHRLVRTAAVSPDGSRVIFQVTGSGAWVLDVADGTMRCVLTDPTAEEFAWSPDGRRVAFHSRRDGQWGIWILMT